MMNEICTIRGQSNFHLMNKYFQPMKKLFSLSLGDSCVNGNLLFRSAASVEFN